MKRFIDIHIPVTYCNLECHYCYVAASNARNSKPIKFNYSAQEIGKALSKERLGGVCHLNMCGLGETLIPPEVIDITRELLAQGHYIMIVTNGTLTKRFEAFAQFPEEYKKRLGFKLSFHYLEFKRKNLLETFYANAELIKKAGMSFSVEMTPSDELEPYIEEVKSECMKHFGALCHLTIPRDESQEGYKLLSRHSMEEFAAIWGQFDSQMFNFKLSTWEQKRKEYCYAGAWSGLLDIGTGELVACYGSRIVQNIFTDMNKPIDWVAVGHRCPLDHCYNGHSLLALGTIPEIDTCRYCDERDRVNANDGTHWLTNEMYEFLGHRLGDYNEPLSEAEKLVNGAKHLSYDAKRAVEKIKNKV